MTARLSRKEKHSVARMAAASYRNSAISIYTEQARRPFDEFKCHSPFDGRYAEDFVLSALDSIVGPERAAEASYNVVRKLIDTAKTMHREAIALNYCTEDGLPINRSWILTYSKGNHEEGQMMRDSWEGIFHAAFTLRELGYRVNVWMDDVTPSVPKKQTRPYQAG